MSKTSYPSDQQDKFMLRLPDGMRDRIRVVADANGRSMNAEIVAALEEKFPTPLPEIITDPAAKHLLWLANKIRSRPNPNAFRRAQADLYERMARDILHRLGPDATRTDLSED